MRKRQYKGQRDDPNNYQHVSPRSKVGLLILLHSISSWSSSSDLASILQPRITSNPQYHAMSILAQDLEGIINSLLPFSEQEGVCLPKPKYAQFVSVGWKSRTL